jgi:hypothetical protein
MIDEAKQITVPMILSDVAQKAYEEFKSLVLRIFSLLKKNAPEKDLKEKFYDSYIDFARKLDDEGHLNESNLYMSICEMYYRLIDQPDELIEFEGFFTDLFNAFDCLLQAKINGVSEYPMSYDEFLIYFGEKQDCYFSQVGMPSENYNEDTLNEIRGHLSDIIEV